MTDFSDLPPASDSNEQRRNILILGGCLTMFICLACLGVVALAGGLVLWQEFGDEWLAFSGTPETVTTATAVSSERVKATAVPSAGSTVSSGSETTMPATGAMETAAATSAALAPPADLILAVPDSVEQEPVPDVAQEVLNALYNIDYPTHDYFEVKVRLDAYEGERTVTARDYQLGDVQSFIYEDEEIEATLMAVTDHTYFWVQNGLAVEATAVKAAAERFEREYFPTLVEMFGQVWDPGIDNDPHFSVLHITGGEGSELGYFYSNNQYPLSIFEDSNEQEMIYINMDSLALGTDLYDATLVHEVQHLIQWNMDPSETTWLNEGLSQLAEIYLGFTDTAETVDYLENPQTQLNTWAYDEDEVYAHYSATYLFAVYIWEQLGDTAVQELARHPANGLAGVKMVLEGYAPHMTIEQFVTDWAITNYLDAQHEADPRYGYQHLDIRSPKFQHKVETGEHFEEVESLDQFGVHYIDLTALRGETTIAFAGDTAVDLIASEIGSGTNFWYAPPVDDVNASLSQVFDLTTEETKQGATLSYSVWYDLEEDFDFAFVSISTDGGATWQKLQPGSSDNGYNGRSANKLDAANGWIEEAISLDAFVGHHVVVRFDVLTDFAITGQGFALTDIVVSGSDGFATIDNDIEDWQAEGFVYTGRQLPQKWSVTLLTTDPDTRTSVITPLVLNGRNQTELKVDFGKNGGVLVIMPQTPFTVNPADYWLKISQ